MVYFPPSQYVKVHLQMYRFPDCLPKINNNYSFPSTMRKGARAGGKTRAEAQFQKEKKIPFYLASILHPNYTFYLHHQYSEEKSNHIVHTLFLSTTTLFF